MDDLRQKAKTLLESNQVKLVIGYGEGTGKKVKPIFVKKPEDTNKLIYDDRCVQNLAVYLHKHEVKHSGKVAIVAPVKVLKSILLLASEHQIKEEDIEILGISDDCKLLEFSTFKSIEEYIALSNVKLNDTEKQMLATIEQMTREERWEFWVNQFSRCIKCYACRATCSLCYCNRCTVESNQPQWIAVSSHELGNLEWHIMRAMHLAGRCINCGECARACSLDIPLNLLTYKTITEIFNQFNNVSGIKADEIYSLSTFNSGDKENFII